MYPRPLLKKILNSEENVAKFFEDHWEKKPFHVKGPVERLFPEFKLSIESFLELGLKPDLRYQADGVTLWPGMRSTKQQREAPPDRSEQEVLLLYKSPEAHGLALTLLENGGSYEIQHLELLTHRWEAVSYRLAAELGAIFNQAISVDAMLSPKGQVVRRHLDPTATLSIQLEGTKRWTVSKKSAFERPTYALTQLLDEAKPRALATRLPLEDWEWESIDQSMNAPENQIDFVVEPGDVIYVPPGTWHATECLSDASLGMLLQINDWPALDYIIDKVVEPRLQKKPKWRGSPRVQEDWIVDGVFQKEKVGKAFFPYLKEIRDAVDQALEEGNFDEIGEGIAKSYVSPRELDNADFVNRAFRDTALKYFGKEAEYAVSPTSLLTFQGVGRSLCIETKQDGKVALAFIHGDVELVFEEPKDFPFAKALAAQHGAFRAQRIHELCPNLTWEEVSERLVSLLKRYVLIPVEENVDHLADVVYDEGV